MMTEDQNLIPWYCDPISNGLIKEISAETQSDRIPATIPTNIPPISSLVPSGNPSSLLQNNFVEIVFVYCFSYRLFVGDWQGELQRDVIECMLRLSRVLNPTTLADGFQAYPSTEAAIKSLLELSVLVCNWIL
mmetsp:Transcript_16952/g.21629  ORF Transcript_16952/g.21629 Transcript_16952/m.21629 type:complete len:133 (-) Transcript_16952:326-724(-)